MQSSFFAKQTHSFHVYQMSSKEDYFITTQTRCCWVFSAQLRASCYS
jgi:hypothetical protein